MAERSLHGLPDAELELALRGLAEFVDWPDATTPGRPEVSDIAAVIRATIGHQTLEESGSVADRSALRPIRTWRPARRATVLAVAAILALAALAGAVGLGLPGLRLILGEPPQSPPPTFEPSSGPGGSVETPAARLGASMGLGELLESTDATRLESRAGFRVALPADPAIGPPQAAYVDDNRGGQVTLLWAANDALPETQARGVGLLLSEFRGTVNGGFFTKVLDGGALERVRVNGLEGYWISGEPHVLFWDGPTGPVDDSRRWVGDVLIWSDGSITFRLESGLGRDGALAIAEDLR